jgi:Tfp pilus assembly protein PilF
MGDILHQQGQTEEAFAAYDSCLVWKEDNIGCLNNYAYYLSERGERLSKAEEMSYKTIKAEPKNSTYLDTYAWILYMEKRYAEAKIYIEQAVQNLDEKQDNSVILEHADKIKLKIKEE